MRRTRPALKSYSGRLHWTRSSGSTCCSWMACTWPMAPTHPCSVAWSGRIENAWLAAGAEPGPLDDLIGHSITYRIAVGPR
jgi:hypothetical protein